LGIAINNLNHFFNRLISQLGNAIKSLDENGWIAVCCIMLVCGWFFLKGNKVQA
jgi:hypothetical protein